MTHWRAAARVRGCHWIFREVGVGLHVHCRLGDRSRQGQGPFTPCLLLPGGRGGALRLPTKAEGPPTPGVLCLRARSWNPLYDGSTMQRTIAATVAGYIRRQSIGGGGVGSSWQTASQHSKSGFEPALAAHSLLELADNVSCPVLSLLVRCVRLTGYGLGRLLFIASARVTRWALECPFREGVLRLCYGAAGGLVSCQRHETNVVWKDSSTIVVIVRTTTTAKASSRWRFWVAGHGGGRWTAAGGGLQWGSCE